ncbi:Fatty acid amide hydrolase [Lachnellula subtilissima]|uniref:Fatty acid amide hydrolase n=1 Tax=Lachnellula subtilissima TaxID=602034 RepID=A0A8H8RA63_9HELO|nr:Fatty acid amide hydrolase [Lachnellula subtilissima]
MSESTDHHQRFFGYPKPIKGPIIPYKKAEDANPVVRGTLLVVGAWLVSKLGFVQRFLWNNAGFDCLRTLDLNAYTERWDPTVIPIGKHQHATGESEGLDFESIPKLPKDIAGRYHSITDYHAKYLSGELTPLAVAESLLPLIRRDVEPRSHHATSFISTNVDMVLAAAKASTERYKAGKPLSIIDGVPAAVKDECDVAGYRSTYGRKTNDVVFKIAEASSWPVQKLVDGGAVILGKTNMHELGADTTNNNPNWGTPLNPHNDMYYTGGSSGGSAYAVAAGLVPIAIGADGGGSVRIPSSFCGVYGLKPSHSRLEDTGSTVTVTGPLAASMADLEVSYRIMGVPDPSDPTCSLFTAPTSVSLSPSKPKVIGICKPWYDRADPSVKDLCGRAIDYLQQKRGYEVIDIELPYLPEGQFAHSCTILAELAVRTRNQVVGSNKENYLSGISPATKVLLAVGAQTPAQDYILAQQLRKLLMQHLAFLYQKHPGLLIVTPTSPKSGYPIAKPTDLTHGITDGNSAVRSMEYVWLANFCGNPAISVPIGYTDPIQGTGKVPIGLMAMGEWGAEEQLLVWGYEAESYLNKVYDGNRQRPSNWFDVFSGVKK